MITRNLEDLTQHVKQVELFYHPNKKTSIYAGKGLLINDQIKYTYTTSYPIALNSVLAKLFKERLGFDFMYGYKDNQELYFSMNFLHVNHKLYHRGKEFLFGCEVVNSYNKRISPTAYLIYWTQWRDGILYPIRTGVKLFNKSSDYLMEECNKEEPTIDYLSMDTKNTNRIDDIMLDRLPDMVFFGSYVIESIFPSKIRRAIDVIAKTQNYPVTNLLEYITLISYVSYSIWEKTSYELASRRTAEVINTLIKLAGK